MSTETQRPETPLTLEARIVSWPSWCLTSCSMRPLKPSPERTTTLSVASRGERRRPSRAARSFSRSTRKIRHERVLRQVCGRDDVLRDALRVGKFGEHAEALQPADDAEEDEAAQQNEGAPEEARAMVAA